MNTLNTRKIICVLIGFVLALGMQGTADAISRLTRNSGDLQTVTAGRDYQIRFSVTLQGARRGSAYTGYAQTPTANVTASLVAAKRNKTTYYEDDYDPTTDPVTGAPGYQTETQVTYDTAHDYEQESIAIAVTGGGSIKKVASYDVPSAEGTTLNMYESTHNSYSSTENPHRRLSGSVALTLTAPDPAAPVTITITPTTDPTTGDPDPLIFTIYVVGPLNAGGTTVVNATNTDGVELVSDEADTRIDGDFTFAPAANEPVYYSVQGNGRLYVSPAAAGAVSPVSDRKTTPTNNLYTSSSAPVFLDTTGGSSKVTAYISGSSDTATILYLFSGRTLRDLPNIEVQSGDGQTGAPSGRLDDYFEVKVTDGRRRPISGVPVTFTGTDPGSPTTGSMFIPVPGTNVYAATPVAATNPINAGRPAITEATATTPAAAATHHVQTDQSGVAKIYYQLSDTSGSHTVNAAVYGTTLSTTLTATASSTARARLANLEIVSGDNQRGEKGKYLKEDLVVIVRSLAGHRVQNAIIQFRTTIGTLVPAEGTEQPATIFTNITLGNALHPTSGQQIYVQTGPDGEAGVSYNVGQVVEARDVIAEVREEAQTSTQYDFAIDRVTFNVNGTGSSTRQPQPPQPPQQPGTTATLTVTPTTITGPPGSTRDITITASQGAQIGNLVNFAVAGGSASPGSGSGVFTSTLTLPTQDGTYTLDVTSGTQRVPVTVTVSSAAAPDTPTGGQIALEVPLSGAPNSSQSIRVTVLDENGNRVPDVDVTLSITSGGGTFSAPSVTTGPAGTATSTLTLGSTPGSNYFVTASSANYPRVEKRISITGTQPPTAPQPPPGDTSVPRAAGEADAIDVYAGNGQRGILNVRLSELLVVEVTDANGNSVSAERVTFRTTIGSGRFSPARPRTNANGRAQTSFTPTSSGMIRIAASVEGVSARAVFRVTTGAPPAAVIKVSGDAQSGTPGRALANPFVVAVQDANGGTIEGIPVTFSVTAGGGRLSETTATTDKDGRAETTLTLGRQAGINSVEASVSGVDPVMFNTSIEPEIRIAAANRPLMYWIDGGMLYRLAGAKATKIADNINDVAVGGEKLYYIQQTSERSGVLHTANLDGSDAKVIKTLTSVPKGLAIDTANAKLYLTNSWGKIQRLNVDGTRFETNFITGLTDPMHIAVADGNVYWTEAGSSVRAASISGAKTPRNIVTGAEAITGLAAGGGKVFWTEQTGRNQGRVASANPDGTGVAVVHAVTASVYGLAIDPANNQLYWTNGWGKVQRSANASRYQDVATGLISPTAIAIGGPNVQTPQGTTKPSTPTTANRSKYDVNGDGSVDSTDTGLIVLAISTGDTSAKFDVNGDGKVDFSDYLLVSENADAGAAGAPAVFGMKMTALQIQRLQEQVDLLIASGDRSPEAMRALIYFQQLIATARPEKTQLLANYPNPFNPETWIPYELATDTDVRITIYNAQGVVIRTLQLGQQAAGYYTDRERAAYWDGRNAFGEQVASGVYFYQLETDTMSTLRKMVILK